MITLAPTMAESLKDFTAGCCGGFLGKLLDYPLDTVKVRHTSDSFVAAFPLLHYFYPTCRFFSFNRHHTFIICRFCYRPNTSARTLYQQQLRVRSFIEVPGTASRIPLKPRVWGVCTMGFRRRSLGVLLRMDCCSLPTTIAKLHLEKSLAGQSCRCSSFLLLALGLAASFHSS